jgi:hypothetical protein
MRRINSGSPQGVHDQRTDGISPPKANRRRIRTQEEMSAGRAWPTILQISGNRFTDIDW